MDFYRRLVDGLLERGITPVMTLYHWDLPQALEDLGGWRSRDIADRFTDYALVLGKELGDRVPAITTLNEPWCTAYLGHATGEHAPGMRDNAVALRVAHHLNLAHGRATTALRAVVPADVELSVTLNLQHVAAGHRSAGRRRRGPARGCRGQPDLPRPDVAREVPRGPGRADLTPHRLVLRRTTGTSREIAGPIDFLGVNYYAPHVVAAGPRTAKAWPGTDRIHQVERPGPRTEMGWPIQPSGLTDLLERVHRDYAVPITITENGVACDDLVVDGRVHDQDRIDYLREHFSAILDAIDAGVDVRGYFAWTLLDNFEWAWGYAKRFGLVYVDFEDQVRTPKDSAHWYAEVVARNGLERHGPGRRVTRARREGLSRWQRCVSRVPSAGTRGSSTPAVPGIDLAVEDGEFMVLVGPSGCGKSTTLRMLAGLEEVDEGRILIGDQRRDRAAAQGP